MHDNEQELLSKKEMVRALDESPFADLRSQVTRDILCKAQIAKLKSLGYEQVWTKCPDCLGVGSYPEAHSLMGKCSSCKGTGKITDRVKWDREKVAKELIKIPITYHSKEGDWVVTKENGYKFADQLKEILTKDNE